MDFTQGIRSYLTRQIQESLSHLVEGGVVAGITGDVVLEDLALRKNLLRNLLNLPLEYDIARGTAKELRVSIPWARIIAQSQPVVQVTLKTVEILVKRSALASPRTEAEELPTARHQHPQVPLDPDQEGKTSSPTVKLSPVPPSTSPPRSKRAGTAGNAAAAPGGAVAVPAAEEESPDKPKGWLHVLGKKLLMNVQLRVDNLTIRYEEDDGKIAATAYICHVLLHSADPGQEWQPAYNECDPPASPWLFKAVHLDDVTVCLDGCGSTIPTTAKRRHEAPLVDRASLRLKIALDVRDIFQVWGGEEPPTHTSDAAHLSLPAPAPAPAPSGLSSFFRGDFFSPVAAESTTGPSTTVSPHPTHPPLHVREPTTYDGHLPPTFGALCPLLSYGSRACGRDESWRVPRSDLGPWDDSPQGWSAYGKEEDSQQQQQEPPMYFDSRAHAAVLLDVECARLRLSFSEHQAMLLRELLAVVGTRHGGKAEEEEEEGGLKKKKRARGAVASSDEPPPNEVCWYDRLHVTSVRLQTLSLTLVRHGQAVVVGGGSEDSSMTHPPPPSSLSQASWVFLRLRARDLSLDHQELRGAGKVGTASTTTDTRLALGALEIAYAGEDVDAEEKGWEEEGGILSSSMPMRLLLQWGEKAAQEKKGLRTAAAVLIESLFDRVLLTRASTRSDEPEEEVLPEAEEGLQPGEGTVLVLRKFAARIPADGHRAEGNLRSTLDVLLTEDVHLRLTPAAVVGLAAFAFVQPSSSSSSSSSTPSSSLPMFEQARQHCRAQSVQVSFTCVRPQTGLRHTHSLHLEDVAMELRQGSATSLLRNLTLARLCLGTTTADPGDTTAAAGQQQLIPLLQMDKVGASFTTRQQVVLHKRSTSTDIKLSLPTGALLSVLPAHMRLTVAILSFLQTADAEPLEEMCRTLPLRRPPPSFVEMTCSSGLLEYGKAATGHAQAIDTREVVALVMEGFCVREKSSSSSSSPTPLLSSFEDDSIILRTPQVVVHTVTSAQEGRKINVSGPQHLTFHVSPLKVLAFRDAMIEVARFVAAFSSSSPTVGSTQEVIRIRADAFTVRVDLPWLDRELPRVVFTCNGGEWVATCADGPEHLIQNHLRIFHLAAEGHVPHQHPPTPQASLASVVAPQGRLVEAFLTPADAHHLTCALQGTQQQVAGKGEMVTVPLLIPEEDAEQAFFEMQWQSRRHDRAMVHMEVTFGSCDFMLYFPFLYALIRLGTLATTSSPATKRERQRARAKTLSVDGSVVGQAEEEEALPRPTLLLKARPSRVLILGGSIQDARFGVSFDMDQFVFWRRSEGVKGGANGLPTEAPTEIRRMSFQAQMGQWRFDSGQGLDLRGAWTLADRVDFEVEGGAGVEEEEVAVVRDKPRLVHISPLALTLGTLEMAVLWRVIGVFGRSVTRAPPVEGGGSAAASGRDTTLASGAGEGQQKEQPNMRLACPYLYLSFKTPRPSPVRGGAWAGPAAVTATTPRASIARVVDEDMVAFHLNLEGCAMEICTYQGRFDVREVVVKDCCPQAHLHQGLAVLPRPEFLSASSSTSSSALAIMWRKSVGGNTSDVVVQLQPSVLRLDTRALALLGGLGNFVNLNLEVVAAKDAAEAQAAAAASLARRNLPLSPLPLRRTETVKLLSDNLQLVLLPRAGGRALEIEMDQLLGSYRVAGYTVEQYLNLVQARARVVVDNTEVWPLVDRANMFLTMEETRVPLRNTGQANLLTVVAATTPASPPPVVSLHVEPLHVHVHPLGLAALQPLAQAFSTGEGSGRAAASSSAAAAAFDQPERARTQLLSLSALEMVVLDRPLPEADPGTLLARATPALLQTPAAPPRDPRAFSYFKHVHPTKDSHYTCYTALSWAFPVPVRTVSVWLPDPLLVYIEYSGVGGLFPAILELVVAAEGEEGSSGTSGGLMAVVRFDVCLHVGQDGTAVVAVDAKEEAGDFQHLLCDHEVGGRRWQLNLYWDDSLPHAPPLECLWRPLVLSLADQVGLEMFEAQADQVQRLVQLTVPHALVRLYPLSLTSRHDQEEEKEEELALLSLRDLQASGSTKKAQSMGDGVVQAGRVELDVVDLSRWTLLPAFRGESLVARFNGGKGEYALHAQLSSGSSRHLVEVRHVRQPTLDVVLGECRLNVSRRILESLEALRHGFGSSSSSSSKKEAKPKTKKACYRYKVLNRTQHTLWLGQHLTNEMLRAAPRSDQEYSVRAWPESTLRQQQPQHQQPSLLLRFALSLQKPGGEATPSNDKPSVWSEPVEVDLEGARCVSLRTSGEGLYDDVALLVDAAGTGGGSDAASAANRQVLLWVVIEKTGLETRISLHGGCEVRNHLPMGLDLRLCPKTQSGPAGASSSSVKESVVSLDAAAGGLQTAEACEGPALLLDEALMDKKPAVRPSAGTAASPQNLMVVQARLSSPSSSFAEASGGGFGQAMVLTLPEAVGPQQACLSIPETASQERHPKATCTVLGQAPSPRPGDPPVWFLCHLRRMVLQSQQSEAPMWGWLSLEVWPLAYIMSSGPAAQYRVLPWKHLDPHYLPPPPSPSLMDASASFSQTPAPASPARVGGGAKPKDPTVPLANPGGGGLGLSVSGSSNRDVDAAKRAIQEKIQRLSYKRLQERSSSSILGGGEEATPGAGLKTPTTKSVDPSVLGERSDSPWQPLASGTEGAVALATADPRHGLALSLRGEGNSGSAKVGFFVSSHTLLAWIRSGDAGHFDADAALDETPKSLLESTPAASASSSSSLDVSDSRGGGLGSDSGLGLLGQGLLPYAMRRPAALGPSLLLHVVPAFTVANHCPFPLSLVTLTPRHSQLATLRGPSDTAAAASEFGGFHEVGLQVLGAGGKEVAADVWSCPPSSSAAPVSIFALGLSAAEDFATGELTLREAQRHEPWATQSWSKPLSLHTLLASLGQPPPDKAENAEDVAVFIPIKESSWLPLSLRLVPTPLLTLDKKEGAGFMTHRLEIRPRLVLQSSVKLPEAAALAVAYHGRGFHTPLSFTNGNHLGLQVLLLERSADAPLPDTDAGWISPQNGSPINTPRTSSAELPNLSPLSPAKPSGTLDGSASPSSLDSSTSSAVVPGRARGLSTSSAAFKRVWCRAARRPSRIGEEGESSDEEEGGVKRRAPSMSLPEGQLLGQEGCVPYRQSFRLQFVGLGQPLVAARVSSYSPLEMEVVDEAAREIRLLCARPGAGLWGLNGKDVLALKVKLEVHQGTHHVVVSVEPSTPLIVVNRSCLYDVDVGLERRPRKSSALPAAGGQQEAEEEVAVQQALSIVHGARVEWDPVRPALRLHSVAQHGKEAVGGAAGSGKAGLDESRSKGAASTDPEGAAVASYRRNTFPTKHVPLLHYRVRCAVSPSVLDADAQKEEEEAASALSKWSSLLHTGEECDQRHALDLAFSSPLPSQASASEQQGSEQEREEEEIEGCAQELLRALRCSSKAALTVSSSHAAGMSCLIIEDGLPHDRTTTSSGTRLPSFPQLDKQQPQPQEPVAISVRAAMLEVQLLEDEAVMTAPPPPKGKDATTSTLVLPAVLFARMLDVHGQYSCLQLPRGEGSRLVKGYRTIQLTLGDMQVDHLVGDAEFPVVICFLKQQQQQPQHAHALDFHFTEAALNTALFGESRPQSYVETLSLACVKLRVAVDGSLLETIRFLQDDLAMATTTAATHLPPPPPLEVPGLPIPVPSLHHASTADVTPRVFFRSVQLSALSVLLDARVFVPGPAGSDVFLGLDNSPLFFEEVRLADVTSTPQAFVKGLLANYVADAILRSPAVLGSLEIFGSPAVLASRIASGIKDMAVLSTAGFTGPARGLLSLTRHVVGGTLASVSGITSSWRRNLNGGHRARAHHVHHHHHNQHRRSSAASTATDMSIASGALVGGASAAAPPAEPPPSNRLLAGAGHVGWGLYKAVTVPVSGLLGAAWWTSELVIRTTGVNDGVEEGKARLDYGVAGPGASCALHREAFYRLSCRLRFRKGAMVGEAKAYLEQRRGSNASLSVSSSASLSVSTSASLSESGWLARMTGSSRESTQIVPVTLVLAEDALFVLSGSHGTEHVVHCVRLASVNKGAKASWRHVRVEASASSLGSEDGVTLPKGLAKYEAVAVKASSSTGEGVRAWWWHLVELRVAGMEHPLKLWLAEEDQVRLLKGFLGRWVAGM